jgi:DNA-binding beta-propeller fold protein YncE
MGTKARKALLLAAAMLLVFAPSAFALTGQLTQLSGTDGCVSWGGTSGECVAGRGLTTPTSVAVSSDGKNVYVASGNDNRMSALLAFARNSTTGAITQLAGQAGCIKEQGGGPWCADGKALFAPTSLAVSPDGKNVYVTTYDKAIAVFRRDLQSGALTQLAGTAGCISETGTTTNGDACADGKALDTALSVAVSGDGKHVYAGSTNIASNESAVAVFKRNGTTGGLTQLAGQAGCISETGSGGSCTDGRAIGSHVAISADGLNVYAGVGDRVAILRRNRTSGTLSQYAGAAGCLNAAGSFYGPCDLARPLNGVTSVTVSADDKNVYIDSFVDGAVLALSRNTTTGRLTQLAGLDGCTSNDGTSGLCRRGRALNGVTGLGTSPDGVSVYVASRYSDAISVFSRNTTTGALTQLLLTAGCVSETGSSGLCTDGKALDGAYFVTVSPDNTSVYAASFASRAVDVFARETAP